MSCIHGSKIGQRKYLINLKNMGRNTGKPAICRIASLSGFGGVLLGRDIGGLFTEGHVYSAINVDGVIVLTDLGDHAKCDHFKGNRVGYYATDGTHCLTLAEHEAQIKDGKY